MLSREGLNFLHHAFRACLRTVSEKEERPGSGHPDDCPTLVDKARILHFLQTACHLNLT